MHNQTAEWRLTGGRRFADRGWAHSQTSGWRLTVARRVVDGGERTDKQLNEGRQVVDESPSGVGAQPNKWMEVESGRGGWAHSQTAEWRSTRGRGAHNQTMGWRSSSGRRFVKRGGRTTTHLDGGRQVVEGVGAQPNGWMEVIRCSTSGRRGCAHSQMAGWRSTGV